MKQILGDEFMYKYLKVIHGLSIFYFKQNTRQKWDIVEFRSVPAHIEN